MTDIPLSSLKDDYVRALSEKEPKWLADIREYSFSYYQNLPTEVSPLYNKYSGVSVLKPEQIFLSSDHRTKEPFSALDHRIDEAKSGICVVHVGDDLNSVYIPRELKSKGVIIESIKDAVKNHEELVKGLLTSNIDPTEDKFLALEYSLFNS